MCTKVIRLNWARMEATLCSTFSPMPVGRMQPTLDSSKHAGGRLVFAPDGTLFVTLGERSILKGRVQARDLASDLGKVVRILPDGGIP